MNLKEILEGYTNWVFPTPQIKNLSSQRLKVCFDCKLRSDYQEKIKLTSYCKLCNCILEVKSKCKSCKCPGNYWEK